MRNIANYILFQAGWLACVWPAMDGDMFTGPLAIAGLVILHLGLISKPSNRRSELRLLIKVGLLGTLADTLLTGLGLVQYPTSAEAWPYMLAPPWISALWVLFATLPAHSLSWLKGRPALGFLFGAIGGPLSFFAGQRLGAIDTGANPQLTYAALALEYAICMVLLFPRSAKAELSEV